ncbi:MAG TPA: type I-U CRISPR-associated helicase/endonuclease Cas3 [Acidimicrobiales bacterium]|jgi:CRISPR-associated endonuclease/helicase Cas3|nr:type I-U CRISPR-associated helicase/endonuclease Cas3 [Acidimicrobiales bacterium]
MSGAEVEFVDFFAEVHGVRPFPWQNDLVTHVERHGAWPEVIDAPTGLGKTALLDIAVFVAARSERGGPGRRRTFFIVDRRIVVDEAYMRACQLSSALDHAIADGQDSAVGHVARALRRIAPDAGAPLTVPAPVTVAPTRRSVLPVTRMRGGITWDAAWLDRPDLPGLVVGTVDQLGSRLLFRGYGVSDRRKPIDAALVGTEALILVDEAHLAEAMLRTLHDAQRRDPGVEGVAPATVVQLSATPGSSGRRTFHFDVAAHRANDLAWSRLTATKDLRLDNCPTKATVDTMAGHAARLVRQGSGTVLAICNTVDRARLVHAALLKTAGGACEPLDAEVLLLIGRSRPGDREALTARLLPRFGVDRDRDQAQRPSILVATQTVEVGANLDADGLVTESAPWDALVQRFGRLNRLGRVTGEKVEAVVVHDGEPDPVYGAPRLATWTWLAGLVDAGGGTLDVSPLACRDLDPPAGVAADRSPAPMVTTPILDAWVRTAPPPHPDPPVAPYLHGLGSQAASVSIAWRDGLLDDDPLDGGERAADDVGLDLAALPVLAAEQVEVPLHAARRWLAGESPPPVSDLEAEAAGDDKVRTVTEPFRALAWRQTSRIASEADGGSPVGGRWTWVEAGDLRPGDALVVPAERGGLDRFGWAPQSNETVVDLAEAARFTPLQPGSDWRRRLRLDRGTPTRLGLTGTDATELRRHLRELATDDDASTAASSEQLGPWLAAVIETAHDAHPGGDTDERLPGTAWTPAALATLMAWLRAGVDVVPVTDRAVDVLLGDDRPTGDRYLLTARHHADVVERDDELPECSSIGLRAVTLAAHHTNVGDRARQIATAIGLTTELIRAVELAARWHDLGKTEPRFQVMLCGGDPYAPLLLNEPLAKSGIDPDDRAAYRSARLRSGLPPGARHEAWSAGLVRRHLDRPGAEPVDHDLVVHLVASHHGHARPWLPPVIDSTPTEVNAAVHAGDTTAPASPEQVRSDETVDLTHPARFALLNGRYGRWGLALLEAIVRCADMTVSGEGS